MTAAAQQQEAHGAAPHEDAAWVQIATPLSVADLRGFLDDIERLLHINPLLEVSIFAPLGNGAYRLAASNLSNGREIDTTLTVTRSETEIEVRYAEGLKVATRFRVEAAPGAFSSKVDAGLRRENATEQKTRAPFRFNRNGIGSNGAQLFVTDIYGGGSEVERRARAGEVDFSLNAWGRALHDYLRAWARWRWLAPWRWYMRRLWQPMTPSSRRIVWMIWMISAFEVATMAALVAIWLLFRQAA